MMQVIEMTHSEKVEMYQVLEKEHLIAMLIEANNVINRLCKAKKLNIENIITVYCGCQQSECHLINGIYICSTCNRPVGKVRG